MESQANLLIVEKDDASRDAKLRLFEDAGWNVSAAAPGAEALHDIEIDGFDVFLLGKDAQQGGVNLDEAIKLRNPTAPIVHVGRKDDVLSKANIRGDADGYLIEPFEPQELVTQSLQAVVEETPVEKRTARAALPTLMFRDLDGVVRGVRLSLVERIEAGHRQGEKVR